MVKTPDSLAPIAVLGGGAAGMACALWLKHLGFAPVILEQDGALGGVLRRIQRVNRWVLGMPGKSGPALAEVYARHIAAEAIDTHLGVRLALVEAGEERFRLVWQEREGSMAALQARAIVIATGTRARAEEILNAVPGAPWLQAAGLLSFFPLDHLESMDAWQGRPTAVIGGGDNAHFTALDLAERASPVHLISRSPPRAQPKVRENVAELIRAGRIIEHAGASVAEFRREADGEIAIRLAGEGAAVEVVRVGRVFARLGFAPNTEFLAGLGPSAGVAKTAAGHVRVDAWKRASLPGVYAIGEVTGPAVPAVATALADGAVAARAIALDCGGEA